MVKVDFNNWFCSIYCKSFFAHNNTMVCDMINVLICGGRDYQIDLIEDAKSIAFALFEEFGIGDLFEVQFITGNARGADQIPNLMYKKWPKSVNEPYKFDARWDIFGKSAGPIRNTQMLGFLLSAQTTKNEQPIVFAFPGGNGTEHMKKISREAGIRVIEME